MTTKSDQSGNTRAVPAEAPLYYGSVGIGSLKGGGVSMSPDGSETQAGVFTLWATPQQAEVLRRLLKASANPELKPLLDDLEFRLDAEDDITVDEMFNDGLGIPEVEDPTARR